MLMRVLVPGYLAGADNVLRHAPVPGYLVAAQAEGALESDPVAALLCVCLGPDGQDGPADTSGGAEEARIPGLLAAAVRCLLRPRSRRAAAACAALPG
eukprot:1159452-Pelagomonas_calceolata.AAC.5